MATSVNTHPPFAPRFMLHALARNWWLILLRGICAIAFGMLTFIWPGVSLLTLILLYGAFALADGIFSLAAAITGSTPTPRWWLAVVGVLGIAAGTMTFLWPGLTAIVLQIFIACWAVAIGVMQIIGAIQLRKEIRDEWLLIAGGALSIVFGIILLTNPRVGALALLYVIGSYAILYGILLVSFSVRLRGHSHPVRT